MEEAGKRVILGGRASDASVIHSACFMTRFPSVKSALNQTITQFLFVLN